MKQMPDLTMVADPSQILWRLLLEAPVRNRNTANEFVRMGRVPVNDILQLLSMRVPTNNEDSLPEFSRNGFPPKKAVKKPAPGIEPCDRRDSRQTHINPRQRRLKLKKQRKTKKSCS